MFKVAEILPFFPAVELARGAVNGSSDGTMGYFIITLVYGLAALIGAVAIYRKNMRKI